MTFEITITKPSIQSIIASVAAGALSLLIWAAILI